MKSRNTLKVSLAVSAASVLLLIGCGEPRRSNLDATGAPTEAARQAARPVEGDVDNPLEQGVIDINDGGPVEVLDGDGKVRGTVLSEDLDARRAEMGAWMDRYRIETPTLSQDQKIQLMALWAPEVISESGEVVGYVITGFAAPDEYRSVLQQAVIGLRDLPEVGAMAAELASSGEGTPAGEPAPTPTALRRPRPPLHHRAPRTTE